MFTATYILRGIMRAHLTMKIHVSCATVYAVLQVPRPSSPLRLNIHCVQFKGDNEDLKVHLKAHNSSWTFCWMHIHFSSFHLSISACMQIGGRTTEERRHPGNLKRRRERTNCKAYVSVFAALYLPHNLSVGSRRWCSNDWDQPG